MTQKFLILSYSFQGKFLSDEKGPSNLKQYIAISDIMTIVVFPERDASEPQYKQEGPLVHATLNSLEECELFLKEHNGPNALFVLPIFELT